jgi:hypothetical protein
VFQASSAAWTFWRAVSSVNGGTGGRIGLSSRWSGPRFGACVWSSMSMLVAVTDHAAERFRQRVRGTLDAKLEIASRVARAHAGGRVQAGSRGTVLVRDLERRDLVYVCRPDAGELVVVTLWEEGEDAAVPRRFTDALRRDDHRVG